MDGSYSLEELLEMMDECLDNGRRMPFGKRDLVDVDQAREILERIRRLIPTEVDDAKRIVSDKNQIISRARQDADRIVKEAEKRRNDLLDQSDMMQEARSRANEILQDAQNKANQIYATSVTFADSTLAYLEQVFSRDLGDIHTLRTNLANSGNVAGGQQKPQGGQPASGQPRQVQQPAQPVSGQQPASGQGAQKK